MDEPTQQTNYVEWSGIQIGMSMVVMMMVGQALLFVLLYLRMTDVVGVLQQQVSICAAK